MWVSIGHECFLHQSIHHTLRQAVEWVQNSSPLFNQSANPLSLDYPLPAGVTLRGTLNNQA